MVAARLNPTQPCATDESLPTRDATALMSKLASRRTGARLGCPVTASMRRGAFARARAPMLAEVLALTAARKARSRLVGNRARKARADHRLRPARPRDGLPTPTRITASCWPANGCITTPGAASTS